MEQLQKLVPDAKFVKAFNSVGNTGMYKPALKDTPTMFICGNDEGAKQTVTQILESFGWETADMGKVEAARAIEPLCMLWCILGFTKNEWGHAFKLLKPLKVNTVDNFLKVVNCYMNLLRLTSFRKDVIRIPCGVFLNVVR